MFNSKKYENRHSVVESLHEIFDDSNKNEIITALLQHRTYSYLLSGFFKVEIVK